MGLAALLPLALFGCSTGKPAAVRKPKEGGWVRVVNATDHPIMAYFDGAEMSNSDLPPGSKSGFRKEAPRTHKIAVGRIGTKQFETELKLEPGELVSIAVMGRPGQYKTARITGEVREPTGIGSTVRLTSAALPKAVRVSLKGPSKEVALGTAEGTGGGQALEVPDGKYTVLADGKKVSEVDLEPAIAYSVMVYQVGGRLKASALRNTRAPMIQTGAGAVQAGG